MSLVTLSLSKGDKDGIICNRLFGLTRSMAGLFSGQIFNTWFLEWHIFFY